VPQDEFAVACFMAVELKTELVRDQGLKQRLALDERKVRDIPIVEMQEIEGVVDELDAAFAVGRRLGLGEARQSCAINAAEFAVDVGGLHSHIG
jgi:hypothetical protein